MGSKTLGALDLLHCPSTFCLRVGNTDSTDGTETPLVHEMSKKSKFALGFAGRYTLLGSMYQHSHDYLANYLHKNHTTGEIRLLNASKILDQTRENYDFE